ncbi:LysR family transcriptional regulator [Pseudoruegeria sp. SHC-113]|uniref:LysR family transcriptional regulator n=1 Tax=Pseudoruegeria sp. SHC-113 TaxID=2855439 RepID=UPI0021BB5392|nr:LysR family transcriptional regulator [Pseudoruegeria sp. SHC-113]MCT8160325.1 LysR family transcriptional regulator [Pseudoruegeria sp. SHC-113]
MQWDDLRIFLAVARHESLSGAGKALKLDPATVGRRIARLEEGVGAVLFAKSPQGYSLTDEGQNLRVRTAEAEQSIIGGLEQVRGQTGQLTGIVRIGAPDGAANYLLPQVCAQICEANPGLEVQIVALPRVFNLSRREADMAIAVSPPSSGRLVVQKITDYRLHLAGSVRYLARAGTPQSLDDLKHHKLIGYIPDMIFDKELEYLAEVGVRHVDFSSNSVAVQLNWARQGAGLTVAHDFALPSAPELRKVLTSQAALTRSFYLIRHATDRRVPRLNRFAEALTLGLRKEVARLEALT